MISAKSDDNHAADQTSYVRVMMYNSAQLVLFRRGLSTAKIT